MKKKIKTLQDHIQEMKKTKELLPLHKMDELSRRNFIQSVGIFLGGLMVPSMIRLETMSNLSRKILGNSTAFAQGFGSGPLDLHIYLRSGFSSRYLVGYYGDDGVLAANANVPWATGVTSTATGDMPVILPPNAQNLVPFAGAIQHIVAENTSGHTEYFQCSQRPGMGELLALRAATEDDAGYKPLLSTPFVFGNTQNVAVQDLPSTLTSFTPMAFSSIANAYQQFSPLTLTTNQGNTLTTTLRNTLLGIVGSKFEDDVTKGVLQKDTALITSASDQTVKILKTNYSDELNPNNDAGTMALLTAGLGSQGNLSVSGMNPAQAMYVMIKQAVLGVGPMTAGMIGSTGDWHDINALAAGDGSGDDREVTGEYIAKLIANVVSAAQAGTWENPNGTNLEIRVHVHSEFSRTIALTGTANDNNGDGQGCTSLVIGSDTSQTDFKPGCYGGTNTTSQEVGFNASTNEHSSSIAWVNPDILFGHKLNLLKIKKDLFNLTTYAGFPGDMA
jgi:hypothetical protein